MCAAGPGGLTARDSLGRFSYLFYSSIYVHINSMISRKIIALM